MNTSDHHFYQLREQGFRITKSRKAIYAFFQRKGCALSAKDIHRHLLDEGLKTDLSTVYRELQFLVDQGIVHEVVFKDGVMRYELESVHHHHLVCTGCKTVISVDIESEIEQIERKISLHSRFSVRSHMLEFYGLCESCLE